jgi:ATP-dependent Lon protease
VVEEILDLRGADDRIRTFVRAINEPGPLADTSGYAPDLTFEQKKTLLATLDVVERLQLALRYQRDRLAELLLRKKIREEVESGAQKQQRELLPAPQMERHPQGAGRGRRRPSDELSEEDRRGRHARRPCASRRERELGRLERMGDQSPASRDHPHYLDWLLRCRGASARRSASIRPRATVLDADHAGLDDVKSRITEYIGRAEARAERAIPDDKRSGVILT